MNAKRRWSARLLGLVSLGLFCVTSLPAHAEQLALRAIFEEFTSDAEAVALPSTVRASVLSPDGRHLYVARNGDYEIVVFDRDPVSGALTFVGEVESSLKKPICVQNGSVWVCNGTFSFPQSLRMSPDGGHVYGCLAEHVVHYERHPVDGLLAERDVISAPAGFCQIEISADGSELYVAGWASIHVFGRDALTGQLTPGQTVSLDATLDRVSAVAVSADGQNIYVASNLWNGGSIGVLRRESVGGDFQVEEIIDDGVDLPGSLGSQPSSLWVSPDGAFVYATVEIGWAESNPSDRGRIVTFRREPSNGRLSVVGSYGGGMSVLESPSAIVGDAAGTRLVVMDGGLVRTFARDATTGGLTFLMHNDPYCSELFQLSGGIAVSSDGQFVYGGYHPRSAELSPKLATFQVASTECRATPRTDCTSADKSALLIQKRAGRRSRMKWKWRGMRAGSADGDNHAEDGFAICVYANDGVGSQLVHESYAPAGRCWASSSSTWSFRQPDVVTPADRLAPHVSKARVMNRSTSLGVQQEIRLVTNEVDANPPALPLPASGPVQVQFVREDGMCWEASYDSVDTARNDAALFKAKNR